MPYTFDCTSFGKLAADAEQLAGGAGEHERRLASVIDSIESGHADDLLPTLRELCAGAREHRRMADSIRARLTGTIASASGDAVKRPLVLIVDDSPDNRDMAAMLLETSGFDTVAAGNGLDGVIVAHCMRPAVVIMDVAMPVLDGVQAARLLKASQVTQGIALIAYTAKMNLDDPPLDRLFVEVLRKPASPESIVGLVERFARAA
jgi:CheY-like chemotaxis protein